MPAKAHGPGELPNYVRYAALGDSITAGWGSPPVQNKRPNGYVSQLHRQLLTRGRADLHNLGIPGLTSGQLLFMMNHWPEFTEQVKQAHLITLSIGGNDIIWTEHQSPGDSLEMRDAMEKYEQNILQILQKIRALNPHARIFALQVYNPFPKEKKEHAKLREWIQSVNESLAKAANLYEADVVPVASLFQEHEKKFVNLAHDDIHPNLQGHTKIAEQISQELFGLFVPLIVDKNLQPNLLWNGMPKKLPESMMLENDTMYIEAEHLAGLFKESLKSLHYRIGNWWIRVNGRHVTLHSPILMKDGRPYLPLRAVSETLGAQVYWVEESQTISVLLKPVSASREMEDVKKEPAE